MKNTFRNDFIKCGVAGWCMEVLWTGASSCFNKDKKMMGNTSILMFPIYGMMACLKPVTVFAKKKNILLRGVIYTFCIYLGEYAAGSLLKKQDMCPWDYSKSKYHVNGLIRLDYAPAWFGAGLLFEKILRGGKG